MKKIGILTFHRTINYGGVLQAFALKRICENLGAECNIINHKNIYIDKINQVKLFDFRSLKIFINELLSYKSRIIKLKRFIKFREKYLKPKDFVCCNIEKNYDAFISGSDQVWNYMLSDFDTTYFLEFVKDSNKKYSYAASFGFSEVPQAYVAKYKTLLSSFNKISVREEQGAKIVENLIKKQVPIVLDPTLLLDKDNWIKEFALNNKKPDNYILLYLMVSEPNILKFAENLSKQTGYKIIYITSKIRKSVKARYYRQASPVEWVELFLNAAYVITNSFHGLAFSINFNKEFFIGLLPESYKVNSRLEYALKLFNLENRMINNESTPKNFSRINYDVINNILEKERKKSIEFLKSIIEE